MNNGCLCEIAYGGRWVVVMLLMCKKKSSGGWTLERETDYDIENHYPRQCDRKEEEEGKCYKVENKENVLLHYQRIFVCLHSIQMV
ncbi:hypothetical protein M0804_008955 [Polistes exclamans]|nr:hypothetical protein M0804_008955 [Polistes exclamans]